jgi:hypothetical protein
MFNSSVRGKRPGAPKRHVPRREERVEKTKSASICIDGEEMYVACTVRDIHSSGARLSIVNPQGIADSFLLMVRSDNLVARCKVAWRKTNEIGVRFLRTGDLSQEQRFKKEQRLAYQQEGQQRQHQQDEIELRAEQEQQAQLQIQAQREQQMRMARLQIMGMDPTQPYTVEDLKGAFRRQAMHKHPDQGGDPTEFRQLTEIYNLMLQAFQSDHPGQSENVA